MHNQWVIAHTQLLGCQFGQDEPNGGESRAGVRPAARGWGFLQSVAGTVLRFRRGQRKEKESVRIAALLVQIRW
jgi:hypothetical protein